MFTSPNLTARARNAWLRLTIVMLAAFVVSLLPYVANAGSTESQSNQKRPELLALVESQQVYDKYYNEAFVIMQYFGYLRRTADASYLDWINTMNQTNGDYRIMINGFMNSAEYRRRFGP